jgi:hypothetical protein
MTLSYPRKCVRVTCMHCGGFNEFGKHEAEDVATFRVNHARCRQPSKKAAT